MNKKRVLHIIAIMSFVIFIVLGLASATVQSGSSTTSSGATQQRQEPASSTGVTTSAQPQVGQSAPSPASLYWNGDGGRGKSIAILAPKASGLAENQAYLPALVQGEFVSNFTGFSAISVLDRERLDEQYAELLSGYYSDDDAAGLDLGRLRATDYIQTGSITKTATGYALQIQITKTADKMTAASYSGTFTFAELDNFTGIRRASMDLLQKMGVTLTANGREELAGAAMENQVNAQTALAKGITAQRQGTEVAALSYYFQAAAYDPSLMEAANRSSILNANITSGNIGDNVRGDISWRDEWVARLTETEQFFDSFNRAQSMPYTLFYTSEIKQGAVDYNNRTVALSIETHLHGSGIWTVSIERALQAVYDGLDATKRKETWGLASWPQRGITNLNVFSTRSQNFSAVFELLNNQNKVIGRQTLQSGGSWGLNWSGRPVANVNADVRRTLNFQNVSANDITDSMTIRVATINGTDAEVAAKNGVLQIRASTESGFARNDRWRFEKGEVQGFANDAARNAEIITIDRIHGQQAKIVIPGTIWGDPVISIGQGAFRNNFGLPANSRYITNVTIPDSVISIGEEAFGNNSFTSITIGKNVLIAQSSFFISYSTPYGEHRDNLFLDYYNKNGMKAGAYKIVQVIVRIGTGATWYNTSASIFPSDFIGTWKRDKSANTLTITTNTIKNSSSYWDRHSECDLMDISGDSYTLAYDYESGFGGILKMTIKFVNGNLVISGFQPNIGSREYSWNGTWKKR